MRRKIPPIERFNSMVVIASNGCCEWVGCLSPQGYGQFWNGSGQSLAHRWYYEDRVGPIPEGMVIDHLCRNTRCVNIEHLDCVKMKTNTERGCLYDVLAANAAAKTHCKRGHPLSGDNLIIDSRGDRGCKTCQRDKANEWRERNRERVNYLQSIRRAECKATTA